MYDIGRKPVFRRVIDSPAPYSLTHLVSTASRRRKSVRISKTDQLHPKSSSGRGPICGERVAVGQLVQTVDFFRLHYCALCLGAAANSLRKDRVSRHAFAHSVEEFKKVPHPVTEFQGTAERALRSGSVCLNRFRASGKWISDLIMLPLEPATAG